jgi:hypothetical protein
VRELEILLGECLLRAPSMRASCAAAAKRRMTPRKEAFDKRNTIKHAAAVDEHGRGDRLAELCQKVGVGPTPFLAEARLAQVDPMQLIEVDEFGHDR